MMNDKARFAQGRQKTGLQTSRPWMTETFHLKFVELNLEEKLMACSVLYIDPQFV